MEDMKGLYRIGLFSKMNRTTIKTLRHYDEIGLLKPACVDQWSGYRYYTSAQLPILHKIIALRELGFTLDEIKKVQDGMSERELLNRKKQQILAEIASKTAALAAVECYLAADDQDSGYHVVMKELPAVQVASMRRIVPDYRALGQAAPDMEAELERLGCEYTTPQYCFNIYHDGEYKETDIDVEICEAVTERKEDTELIKFKTFPKVEQAACVLHRGPYHNLPRAYGEILRFAEQNGYQIADMPRESYIDGIWNKDREEEWLTEIQLPVKNVLIS